LLPEYDLAALLKGGVQGKYAGRYREGTNLALLDPDVAGAFPTDKAVNDTLRLVAQLVKSVTRSTAEAPRRLRRAR
jgi:hypothetical protein